MRKLLTVGVLALGLVLGALGAVNDTYAVTCPPGSLKEGQDLPSYAECNLDDAGQPDLMETVTTILNVIVGIIGVLAVAVIIIGAVYFVTSQGDASKVARGRNTILYGIVGLVISLLAFAIVNFVLGAVFGGSGSGGSGGTGGGTGGGSGGGSGGSGTPDVSQVVEL